MLHPAFTAQMEKQLGSDAGLYFASLEEPYQRGVRLNPAKPAPLPEGAGEPVPWNEKSGRYLSAESAAGAHPLHEAGAWYIQEPSAMAPAALLAPRPGERILDLCAAPGGKSTQIAEYSPELLVCNEPVPSRAKILSRNIERMGISRALVVSEDPDRLAAVWPEAFDAVLVDAPCSGEGMFRRHPETRDEWEEASPAGCAVRQSRILDAAVRMLRPGGRLVYSTCTFNTVENEGVIAGLLSRFPEMETVPFSLPGCPTAPEGMLHLYPHQIRGEGHFAALLRKKGEGDVSALYAPAGERLGRPDKALLAAWNDFRKGAPLPAPNAVLGDALLSAPDLPPLRGIRVLRAGLQLGAAKGKVFLPDHALALALKAPFPFPAVPLTEEQARLYQSGEVLPAPEELSGWALPVLDGLPLGWGKISGGQMKNHYPKGLRKP